MIRLETFGLRCDLLGQGGASKRTCKVWRVASPVPGLAPERSAELCGTPSTCISPLVGIPSLDSWLPMRSLSALGSIGVSLVGHQWKTDAVGELCHVALLRYRFRDEVPGYEATIDVLKRYEAGTVPRATAFLQEFLKNGINGDGHVRPQVGKRSKA